MLKVLAVIGIVLASIILLFLIILNIFLFVPFRYKIGGSNKETLYGYFLLTFFLSFLRIRVYYKEKMGYASLRLFGIKIFDKEIPELIEMLENLSDKLSKKDKTETKESTNEGSEEAKQETIPDPDTEEFEITEEEIEEFLNEPDETDDMNALEKNISFLSSLKDFILNIKKKWYNFKEFINEKIKQWELTKKYIKFYWKVLNHPSFKPTIIFVGVDIFFSYIFLNLKIKFIARTWRPSSSKKSFPPIFLE